MATLCSRLVRSLFRRGLITKGRAYSESAVQMKSVLKEGRSGQKEISEAFEGHTTHWKFMTYFGVIPAVTLLMYNTFYILHDEEEEDEPLDPEVLGVHTVRKPFPWGTDRSGFQQMDPFGDEVRRAQKKAGTYVGHAH